MVYDESCSTGDLQSSESYTSVSTSTAFWFCGWSNKGSERVSVVWYLGSVRWGAGRERALSKTVVVHDVLLILCQYGVTCMLEALYLSYMLFIRLQKINERCYLELFCLVFPCQNLLTYPFHMIGYTYGAKNVCEPDLWTYWSAGALFCVPQMWMVSYYLGKYGGRHALSVLIEYNWTNRMNTPSSTLLCDIHVTSIAPGICIISYVHCRKLISDAT